MSFEKDLFISYAHIDNQTASEEEQGWITQFHRHLATFLSQTLGKQAQIWRDDRLRGTDVFADEIEGQFPKTAALLSILTPRYLKSEWCIREVDAFCKVAQQTGGLVVDNKSRVIKVMRQPVSVEKQPPIMQDALGYEFFIEEDGRALPLDPNFGKKYDEAYRLKIYILAQDIAELLEELASQAGQIAVPVSGQAKPTVYLAECSYDRREEREKIRGELQAHAYTILPDQRLPELEMDYVAEVDRLLDQCQLAIHLVGTAYGKVPDGPRQESAIVLQNEIAVKKSKDGGLQRVIWLPEGTSSEQAQQQAFIEALHKEADLQTGADLITGDLETFKGAIHATLKKIEAATKQPEPEQQEAAETGPRLVYLICEKRDRKAIIPLYKYLRGQGFKAKLPTFTGDATAVREANEALMKTCDVVLLFWGAGDEAWKSHQENDLRKNQSVRQKPLRAVYTYLAEPTNDDKEFTLELEEPNLIDGLAGFSEAAMEVFVQAVNA